MSEPGLDPLLVNAWLTARSIARGLPMPVPDHGGFRVDTQSDAEVRRWVFPKTGPGLERLGRSITQPRHLLKLCGRADELLAGLPTGWAIHAPGYFMQARRAPEERQLHKGYRIETKCIGMVAEVRILSDSGALAASGYAAETPDVFIYDRIVTAPEHRRKGLGQTVMATLRAAKRRAATIELLVATEEGRALYSTLGWKTISAFSTASLVAP